MGKAVLGLWQKSSWWSAKVVAVTGERVTITWDDGGGDAVLDPNGVAPLPADNSGLAVGDRVYCRWVQGSRWYRAMITKNDQQGTEVRAEDGATQAIEPGQCVATRTVAALGDDGAR